MREQVLVAPAAEDRAVASVQHAETPNASADWGPVQPQERITLMDALRGLALFGIIVANIRGFAGPLSAYFQTDLLWKTRSDFWVQAFVETFIQGKFITLFAFLFGVGFPLQFTRAESRGAKFAPTYRRRLEALILLGAVHQLLFWWGDILVTYGLGGFLLMLFRKRTDKTVLRWAVFLLLLPAAGMSGYLLFRQVRPPKPQRPEVVAQRRLEQDVKTADEIQHAMVVYGKGSYVTAFQYRLREIARSAVGQPAAVALTLPVFLLGLWAFRKGVLQDPVKYRRHLRAGLLVGLLVGIPANVACTWLQHTMDLRHSDVSPTPLMVVFVLLFVAGRPVLSLAYASGLGLLFLEPQWRTGLLPFVAVGRTALSNYLLQTIVATTIFYGYGGRLFGRVPMAGLMVFAIAIYALQVPLSRWWLAQWRFGPGEWLWRTMTYGKTPAMKTSALAAS